MKLIWRLLVSVVALFVVEYLVPGFHLASIWTAIIAAIAIGIVNTLIRPVLQLITLPISILTLGITALLINVLLLWGTSKIIPGFEIANFWTAFFASILLSLVTWFMNRLASD
ncbi:MAG: phage holin family protein [Candidatus Microgenomates bacterium]|jgi:putative membrane protein